MPNQDEENDLMTPTAHALSLSPPRAPPHDSAHRQLMLGGDPCEYALARHHDTKHHRHFEETRHRIMNLLHQSHFHFPSRMPHPHLPNSLEWTDKMTRALGATLPISWLNTCRDSGGFRTIADTLVTISAPSMALVKPSMAVAFMKLSQQCHVYSYGSHDMQVVHMFLPNDYKDVHDDVKKSRGLLVFVHGGAWGSGLPWMYRLVALPFLKLGMAVAFVGYRTWPDADIHGQVDDLEHASNFIANQFPDLCNGQEDGGDHIGTCLMGHSSGAHVSLLMLVDQARQQLLAGSPSLLKFDSFVALSGPFDISHHFDYEAARGVEEFSPMKPANGYSRESFRANSPALRWMQYITDITECSSSIQHAFPPRMLLLHGIEDTTVPFTATAEAARIFKSCGVAQCEQVYVAKVGHQDTVMEIMIGGKTQDEVIQWLQNPVKKRDLTTFVTSSKL